MSMATTPADVRDGLLRAFRCAVPGCGDPRGALSSAYRKILAKADGKAEPLIAEILIRAFGDAVEKALSTAWNSARGVEEDRERIVDLAQKAARSEGDAHLGGDRFPSESMEPLLRALEVSADALGCPTAAANLVALVVLETRAAGHDDSIDHLMSTFEEALSALKNTEAETEILYEACVNAILDDDDPGDAVETLVDHAGSAIAKADDPEAAIEVFLKGLSVEPICPVLPPGEVGEAP